MTRATSSCRDAPYAGVVTATSELRQLGAALRRWARDGVGVVRVLDRTGFGTVEPGQLLAGAADGSTAGALLRGTMDGKAQPLVASAVTVPSTVHGHVAEHPAVAAGLACSGGARLLGHPLPPELADALGTAFLDATPVALVSTVDGAAILLLAGPALDTAHGTLGSPAADEAAVEHAGAALRRGATLTERTTVAGLDVLVDLWVPVPALLVVGSGAIGGALLAQAGLLGWAARRVTGLAETRQAVAGFTDADVLVLLDHAPAFDAALIEALRGGRGFVGALGSRHTQQARRRRLVDAGLTGDELARLHGPVGLDLGARTPAETAVSVVAEVIAVRGGRSATPLGATGGRIGG